MERVFDASDLQQSSESASPAPTLSLVGPIRSWRMVHEYSLVLRSMNIGHVPTQGPDGVYLRVHARDLDRSVWALRQYEQENAASRPPPSADRLPYRSTLGAPLLMALLLLAYSQTGPMSEAFGSRWMTVGAADSARIMRGEILRAVTALTLHADTMHVVGNVVAGSLFLGFLARRLGLGLAACLVLLGGVLGNLANAAIHTGLLHRPHVSIGASTGVFAAVGLLVATQLRSNWGRGARRLFDLAGPVVGGLTLLGYFGAGNQHTDLWAHLLGLLAGVLLGAVVPLSRISHQPRWLQALFTAVAIAIPCAAWGIIALR